MLYISNFKKLIFIPLFLFTSVCIAQPAWTFDILGKEKKPEKYEEKLLASEKTGTKKFGVGRKFLQNTVSHYNFFYNANVGINIVLEKAKIAHKDDFAKLLSFYGYTLDNTASQKTELDSVIYRCTAGILLHDLRTNWVDDFYLLMGKAYFLRKDFDSAALTFQFINYNLYPKKKKEEDYDKVVGSNDTETGVGSVSIANKEPKGFYNNQIKRPPSRNEALIWLTRNFIEQKELGDAAGLISILQNDANLPKRLQNDLHEITAYWFYEQKMYDSSAAHLEKALNNADTKEDKSRWQYLLAQMYEMTGNYEKASEYYELASKKTTNILMDIFAKLNNAKMLKTNASPKDLENSISKLLQMTKKDKFEAYKDILFYAAAELTLQKPDTTTAFDLLQKSITSNNGNGNYKEKAFLKIATISYANGSYEMARNYYDSIGGNIKELEIDSATIADRKEILARLVPKIIAVQVEDSLQRIANMSSTEREKFVKAIAKKIRKENGLKDEAFAGTEPITFANGNTIVDLFKTSNANNGQWYFYNAGLKGKGFTEFKQKWGKRSNIDNWRRNASTASSLPKNNAGFGGAPGGPDVMAAGDPNAPAPTTATPVVKKEQDFSFEGLMGNVPLTKEQLDSSNNVIASNLIDAALIFQNELQDYNQAINYYNQYLDRFSNGDKIAEAYGGLAFCYEKIGDKTKAAFFRNILKTKFADSEANKILSNPDAYKTNKPNQQATDSYEKIYTLFAEGKYEEAARAKAGADSLYGKSYWSPQLLYIEAIGLVKANKDSQAVSNLNSIITSFPSSALKPKTEILKGLLDKKLAEAAAEAANKASAQKLIDDAKAAAQKLLDDAKAAELAKKNAALLAKQKVKVDTVMQKLNELYPVNKKEAHTVFLVLNKMTKETCDFIQTDLDLLNKQNPATKIVFSNAYNADANTTILFFDEFRNADSAAAYCKILKTAVIARHALKPLQYGILIISASNLKTFMDKNNLEEYKKVFKTNYEIKY
jgi:outer membrane protein assembly factor BamD (BamD/ComL family)